MTIDCLKNEIHQNHETLKVVTIVGARPQFIKAAALSRIIRNLPEINEILVHTGQHYDDNMSNVFFDELDLAQPNYNLGISGGKHGEQTGRMLISLEKLLITEAPDMVILYGDTNSTLAGTLAAVKLHIPIAHIEAGLRSFNKKMPEEINRILTDHCSDLLFTPTESGKKNLENEGINRNKIFHVGDVMYDSTLHYSRIAENKSKILNDLSLTRKEYILGTIHRAENTDNIDKLKQIFKVLETIAEEITLVLTLHPRTKKSLKALDFEFQSSAIKFIEPVGYLDMLMLEKHSNLIITDSGGVQKEAYFQKVPCITLRNETEWVELVENGWNVLANLDNLLDIFNLSHTTNFPNTDSIYGGGKASEKIVDILKKSKSPKYIK